MPGAAVPPGADVLPAGEAGLGRRAIGWALLSQAIWLPLLLIAVHDRWLAPQLRSASPSHGQEGRGAGSAPPLSLGDVVQAAASPPPGLPGAAVTAAVAAAPAPAAQSAATAPDHPGLVLRSPAGSASLQPPSLQPLTPQASTPAAAAALAAAAPPGRPDPGAQVSRPAAPPSPRRGPSPSQLLGGSMGLQELPAAALSPLAALQPAAAPPQPGKGLAERAAEAPARPPAALRR